MPHPDARLERERQIHVLLVEDNPADADLCAEYLEAAFPGGVRISHATRLSQALDLLRPADGRKVDAILLDLALPDASGMEGLISLRGQVPQLPIVVLTGSTSSDVGIAVIREHAEDYCPKDALTPETLYRLLRHALERHRWRDCYRNLLEISPDGMILLDAASHVLFANAAAHTMVGHDVLGTDKLFPYAVPEIAGRIETNLPGGRVAEMTVVPMDWEGQPARLTVLRDVTVSKSTEKKLMELVQVDQLTGLASRAYFMDYLGRSFRRVAREGASTALLFIDLDRFKIVNDSLGHRVGDALLQLVSQRFKQCIRVGDFLGRLGGDEFGLILQDIKRPEEAAYVARKLLDAVADPVAIEGHDIKVGASIGIAVYPDCGDSTEELLRAADAAMYRAKERGRNNYHFYSQDLQMMATARMKLEAAVRHASESEEFLLYFQPVVTISGDRIVGLEALLRWNDPEYGHLGPEQFVAVAEDMGLIAGIGSWALKQATAKVAGWERSFEQPIRVSVNVSAQQLRRADFADSVANALADSGLPARHLELEVTESVFIGDSGLAVQTLAKLRDLGVSTVIDDFGTGYSSLSYLLKLPISGFKLHKRFLDELGCNAQSEAIIENLIRMAHAIGLTVTVESVETEAQRAFLANCGCDYAQGFYFGHPFPASEVVERLRHWPATWRPDGGEKPA